MEKTKTDKLYEEYLAAPGKQIEIDGKTYYKAITCGDMILSGMYEIILPFDAFEGRKGNDFTVKNEVGEMFDIHGPALINFKPGYYPEWYRKCGEYYSYSKIKGKYFKVVGPQK